MDGHKANIVHVSSRTNLVNLPSRLGNLLANANIKVQDVIVEIVCKGKSSYTGWSGWNATSINSLEIDSILAKSLSLAETEPVVINLKVNNFETRQVNLEPVTSSDWELVELHAQTLEDKLLSQTRCVSLNQVLVVYPSSTTSANLVVTDIGTKSVNFAKLSPECEVAIAPKPRVKKRSGSVKSAKSSRTDKSGDDYMNLPSVLKRSIPLPHQLYADLPEYADTNGYEVYVNFKEVAGILKRAEYVAVSVIPGPNSKKNHTPKQEKSSPNLPGSSEKEAKETVPLEENKRVVARLVNYPKSPANHVGVSRKLAVALSVESNLGSILVLKPSIKQTQKLPSTFTIYPYITQSKKSNQVNINSSEKKEKASKLAKAIESILLSQDSSLYKSPITNFTKLPIIPNILPNGGMLKFKRNDDLNAWIKPLHGSDKKGPSIEIDEELLRAASFIEETKVEKPLSDAIGFESMIQETVEHIIIDNNSGILVHGNSGSGKTLVLKHISQQLENLHGYHCKFISCESIMNENFNSLSTSHFNRWLQECTWYKPSVLILDNLDKLIGAEVEHVDSSNSKNLAEFLVSQVQKIHCQPNCNFSILASSSSKESLNGFLFSSHLIENILHLSPPDKTTRSKLIEHYFNNDLGCKIGFDVMEMVAETEGYLPNDLKTLCDRIYHESLFNQSSAILDDEVSITMEDFEKALQGYTPLNLRGVKLQKSSINWSDIGGLKEAKNILLETLEWPTKYAPIFANCPLRLRSGILLYGYPGCGKTLLASAVAGQCGLNFISIKGPEILNKYIGASEQSVRELFERAQAAKPCILFFDEFDSIAPKRGHDSTGVTDRVVNQMLTQMDGAEGLDGVYVLAATSRPDLIDSALLRPGRLDKSVICSMPDYNDRLDILESITAKMDLENGIDLKEIALQTEGFSGADMQGLGYNAYLKAVHVKLSQDESLEQMESNTPNSQELDFFKVNSEKLKNAKMRPADRLKILQQIEELFGNSKENMDLKEKKKNSPSSVVSISHENFVESLKETKPSISVKEKLKLDMIYHEFVSGRDGNMPDGSASNDIGGRTTLM
ncbi:Peroxisome biosynthesis protein pex1 [Yamadazyma tenuis]|uniref:Peroxisomal ATPase PEX1 n=1 Tax=Candida tenuis (strain ATCC 10573 / BCRC 21748 / CBS 615 / JCM 9827 / NBRC 10315 / NRRL Y-1498 / VKM Y-70) TaxID=590646 RepID=G3BFG5_CANTC|nr:AAA-domain-containing protein [Yamadazyma tenuis ATCC 10573]EGV60686.1 AAA-domain-containing protein [Yamadazyma tenuis ATCC 10573]WEJ94062.1 Peroxisome biosynthesis protein pex1 [Yamadazyma tenuis]